MAKIPLGTKGGTMAEVGLEQEKMRKTEEMDLQRRKQRAHEMIVNVLMDRQRAADQLRLAGIQRDTAMELEGVRSTQKAELQKARLASDREMFEAGLESDEAKFLFREALSYDKTMADRAVRLAEHTRKTATEGMKASYEYGARYDPAKMRWESIPTEDLPPGVPPGGLKTTEFGVRAVEAASRVAGRTSEEQEAARRAQLADAAKIGGYIERTVDRIGRLRVRRDDIKALTFDYEFKLGGKEEGREWVESVIRGLDDQIWEQERRIDSFVASKIALESGYGMIPGWVVDPDAVEADRGEAGVPIQDIEKTRAEWTSWRAAAEQGDQRAAVRIAVVTKAEGRSIDEMINFLTVYLRNRKQYSRKKPDLRPTPKSGLELE